MRLTKLQGLKCSEIKTKNKTAASSCLSYANFQDLEMEINIVCIKIQHSSRLAELADGGIYQIIPDQQAFLARKNAGQVSQYS